MYEVTWGANDTTVGYDNLNAARRYACRISLDHQTDALVEHIEQGEVLGRLTYAFGSRQFGEGDLA